MNQQEYFDQQEYFLEKSLKKERRRRTVLLAIPAICFFIAPGGWANAGTITHYLAQKVVPELAQMIPNSNADTISFAIQDSMEEMEEEFGVECQGILTDYNLAICTRAGE